MSDVNEDAPTVSAGAGEVAGIGVGPDGEPGVFKTKYKDKNKEEAPVLGPIQRRKTFKQFMSGT